MLRIIAIGRLRQEPEAILFQRYADRIQPRLTLTELPEAKGSPAEVKRRESEALLRALPSHAVVVALDLGGQQPDSATFSQWLERWLATGREPCFLIGGAEGVGQPVLDRADQVLSLGVMTWPHFLVRAMLAEQIYRARSISQGHPYHRAGRP